MERQSFDEAQFSAKKQEIRERLEAQRRSDLMQSILQAAQDRFDVERNAELLQEFQTS